ncbi:MAG: lipopolysaccharide biosynthesis protein [Methylobacter sp.]|nr:MAG: lipopolysaccharide biosynthesis protein [Methylobacter sp.]PPD21289.1 MAG: lipopolysaccharide biosynthesis protein [Methylobacter sp.]
MQTDANKARLVAFYLPQFHPIPENDAWWGKGFTEWTNTAKAKPLFSGHYQPHVPADLGFYDLRVPESRAAQAEMAKTYGIEAFCYYHYWFGGKRLLERPFNEVLESGQPDFPFCLCWANQTWTGIWHGEPNRILIEQTYPGMEDHQRHFDYLLPAFLDPRHLRVDGKPIFVVYSPDELPNAKEVTDFWRDQAVKAGLPGLFLMAVHNSADWVPQDQGFDAVILSRLPPRRFYMNQWITWKKQPLTKLKYWLADLRKLPTIHKYQYVIDNLISEQNSSSETYPCVIPNWDNTPRSGPNGLVLSGSTPERFRAFLKKALTKVQTLPAEHRFVFIKSWNEWAEGNHLEPDLKYGHRYLDVIREEMQSKE